MVLLVNPGLLHWLKFEGNFNRDNQFWFSGAIPLTT